MSFNQWRLFVRNSVLERVPENDFASLAVVLHKQQFLTGRKIARIVTEFRNSICSYTDPVILRYLRALLFGNLISIGDVLSTISDDWTVKDHLQGRDQNDLPQVLESDALLVQELAVILATRQQSELFDARICFLACSKLLSAIVPQIGKNHDLEASETVDIDPALSLAEAICLLFASVSGLEVGAAALLDEKDKELRNDLARFFVVSAPLLPLMSMELRQRLEEVQKSISLTDKPPRQKAAPVAINTPDVAQFEMNVIEPGPLHSRAAIFIYLNATLGGTPSLDDTSLMTYLMARYNGDFVNLIIHLILASFDILANGLHRSEPAQVMDLYHCFVSNKLPLLLSYVVKSAMDHIPMEACITQAYSRIDPAVFPAFSSTFDLSNKDAPLADIRQELLFACALHGLISESSIEALLGESSMMTLPTHGLYSRENLAQQISSNPKRTEQLIEELELFEGNAAAVAGAIVDVIQRLCHDKETMTLKRICLQIVRKPRRLDVLALFHPPASFLLPLCDVLDSWKWDEDQGESQPVYDEFGSILLLILTAMHRFGLSSTDLGIIDSESFVLRLMDQGYTDRNLDQLDDTAKRHLGSWITALFISEGLSDELTSSCSPQDFYLLVPTLFSQSIAACNAGKLTLETLRSGFEYLLEGFLLPSLLIALLWLSNHIRSDDSNPSNAVHLLHALIKPTSGSFEAREIHQTIVAIAADPVKQCLTSSKLASQSGAQSIVKLLDSQSSFKRSYAVSRNEMDVWCSTPGGLTSTIQHTFQNLVFWDTTQMSTSPPMFTFKQFNMAIRIHGVVRVLSLFLNELKSHPTNGTFDFALDVLFAIICAPISPSVHQQPEQPSPTQRLTLADALRLEYSTSLSKYLTPPSCSDTTPDISTTNNDNNNNTIIAEALVRLNRRLENLSMVVLPQSLDAAAEAAAAEAAVGMPDDLTSLDLTSMNDINIAAATANAELTSNGGASTTGAENKDMIDQILESTNNAVSSAAAAAAAAAADPIIGTNPNNNGTGNGGAGADFDMGSMFVDLDSANLGLGNDFDLELEGMF